MPWFPSATRVCVCVTFNQAQKRFSSFGPFGFGSVLFPKTPQMVVFPLVFLSKPPTRGTADVFKFTWIATMHFEDVTLPFRFQCWGALEVTSVERSYLGSSVGVPANRRLSRSHFRAPRGARASNERGHGQGCMPHPALMLLNAGHYYEHQTTAGASPQVFSFPCTDGVF